MTIRTAACQLGKLSVLVREVTLLVIAPVWWL